MERCPTLVLHEGSRSLRNGIDPLLILAITRSNSWVYPARAVVSTRVGIHVEFIEKFSRLVLGLSGGEWSEPVSSSLN